MRNLPLFIGILFGWHTALWSQATLTQPTVSLGGGMVRWQGLPLEINSTNSLTLGVGMWRFSPQKVEWTTGLDYHRLQGTIQTYQIGNQGETRSSNWVGHRLHWTTLAAFHLRKPYLNLQIGGFVGLGVGGEGSETDFLDQDTRLPLSLLSRRSDFSYGPILGIGGGSKMIQAHLRYTWDLYDYLPPAGLQLRRSLLTLGLTFVIPGVEVY